MLDPTALLQKAGAFVRNPLGIIGLFVSLIYGVAVVVSGYSNLLTENQRWTIVCFDVAFPLLVLWTFFELVTKHHGKLYAPGDWKDERHVYGPQSSTQRRERIEEEARDIAWVDRFEGATAVTPVPAPVQQVQAIATKERQAIQQVREAEDLVFRKLERRFGSTIQRDVNLPGGFAADGLVQDGRRTIVIEIKVLANGSPQQGALKRALTSATAFVARMAGWISTSPICVLLIFVILDNASVAIRDQVLKAATERVRSLHLLIEVNIEVYDLDELRAEPSTS